MHPPCIARHAPTMQHPCIKPLPGGPEGLPTLLDPGPSLPDTMPTLFDVTPRPVWRDTNPAWHGL